ncbi:DNA repair-scaffolding protein [Sciurus carolinensis]|uniref:DNA repair-scaffolding protein n=1 Tax=Sciurus carolinensis TaxID=30640 RepID=A0AA41T6K1_SCICA|nr:DNA repair-scaffolding protein [Sciurus carolinensis]
MMRWAALQLCALSKGLLIPGRGLTQGSQDPEKQGIFHIHEVWDKLWEIVGASTNWRDHVRAMEERKLLHSFLAKLQEELPPRRIKDSYIEVLLPLGKTTTSKNTSEPTDITWSSSGSDLSDEDKTLSKSQRDNEHGSRIDRFHNRTILCPEGGASEDKLQFIDWEIDSDREDASEYNEWEDGKSAVEISDCASCASSHSVTNDERLSELPKPIFAEILEYSSDSHKEDDSENVLFIDSESPHKYHMEYGSDARQVMDRLSNPRLKSETVLGTPQKQTAKFPRTPENSAKKKKLLRGGLAERLTRLQNRERSAISLWRHQHVSYQKTISGTKSGVLTVKILELHEECTMQVAMCEQLVGSPAAIPSRGVATGPETNLKVLFTQETACYLRGCPQDVIHIFPPW